MNKISKYFTILLLSILIANSFLIFVQSISTLRDLSFGLYDPDILPPNVGYLIAKIGISASLCVCGIATVLKDRWGVYGLGITWVIGWLFFILFENQSLIYLLLGIVLLIGFFLFLIPLYIKNDPFKNT